MSAREPLLEYERELRRETSRINREYGEVTSEERQVHMGMLHGKGGQAEPGTREFEIQQKRVSAVEKMRDLFKEFVIRRKNTSLDNEGKVIHGLPELEKIYVKLVMSPAERAKFADISRKAEETM